MLLFPARVSPWSGRPQGEARGTGGFHQPCTEGKPTARVREHYDSQPGCSLLETHRFSGGRGKMLESPNSRDICLLTKVCISAFLTLGSCFHYYFFFFFLFLPKQGGREPSGCLPSERWASGTITVLSASGFCTFAYYIIIYDCSGLKT